ncbi:MAG: hypothetical protein ACPGYV_10240 [Phycisphaeraceae bacterium]
MPIGGRIIGGGGGAAPAAELWEVLYDVDLTDADNYDFTGSLNTNESVEIDGVTWTAKNGADSVYCDDFIVVDGTGLQVQFGTSNNASQQSTSTQTSPRIQTNISNFFPVANPLSYKDTVAIQVLTSSASLSQDWQAYGVTISDGAASTTKWICNRVLYYSDFTGTYKVATDCEMGDAARYSLSRAGVQNEPGFHEIVWYAASSGFAIGADASAEVKDPLTSTQTQIFGLMDYGTSTDPSATPNLDITTGNATVMLTALYNDQGGDKPAWNATFTRIRVLRRKN